MGPPREKASNSVNVNFQFFTNTLEAPPITAQNLTTKISEVENLFADELATKTSVTAGIHSQHFLLYDKVRQLEPGNSDTIIWKNPSVKFLFGSAKVA